MRTLFVIAATAFLIYITASAGLEFLDAGKSLIQAHKEMIDQAANF